MVFQKSAKKRAEAMKMMEKEMADTSARQEKVDHKLKERIGISTVDKNKINSNSTIYKRRLYFGQRRLKVRFTGGMMRKIN